MPVILFAIFIDLLGFGIIVPILPFLTMKFGGDVVTGAALISVYSLFAFLMGPVWGRFSDRFGRRPALAGTFLGASVSYVVLGFSNTLLLLFLARAMSGAMAGNVGIAIAAMADVTTEENRGKAMGKVGAAFGLGFAFGPGIGGILSSLGENGDLGIMAAGLTAATLSLIAMTLTAFFMPETSPKHEPNNTEHEELPHWTLVIRQPGQFLMFGMFAITAIAQSVSFALTPFWADAVLGWNAAQVGYLLMASGIAVFFLQMFAVGPLFKHFGEVKSLMLGVALNLLGCFCIVFCTPSATVAAFSFPLIMGGLTLAFPALNSLVSRRTNKHLQGTALGMANGFSALGRVAGPIAGATMFGASSNAPFVIVAATGVLMLLWGGSEISRNNSKLITKQKASNL